MSMQTIIDRKQKLNIIHIIFFILLTIYIHNKPKEKMNMQETT